ncbi:MAG: FAD-dependent oxidoreductase [Dehalococcoidia bacterium]|jgi:2,4-dienoyl-CoA reductase-like NADH-dependent reductase (Old Yellow Enzyme family)/thioredoxin reductase
MSETPALTRLFERAEIGSMKLKNRIVMPAMGTNMSDVGYVNRRILDHYEARARGGAGLVIVEVTGVDSPAGKNTANMLMLDDDKYIAGMKELVDTIHKYKARAALQISHTGRGARTKITGVQPVAPSPIPMPFSSAIGYSGDMPRELTVAEIKAIEQKYADAAGRAKAAGFDAVEIHGTGYYLIAQFVSSTANIRSDEYGGDLEKRARFPLEVIEAVREKVGNDFPLLYKMSALELGEGVGLTLDEGRRIAVMLQDAGVDALELAGMIWGADPNMEPPPGEPRNMGLMLSPFVKSVVTIPVIAEGRIDPEGGDIALAEGKADLIAIGRGLLADPRLPEKARSGKLEEIRPCIGCGRCTDSQLMRGRGIMCSVNPAVGNEADKYRIFKTTKAKRVAVIGGGPAGMEAARVAGMRGHRVTLYEKTSRLGGQLNQAVVPPHKSNLAPYLEYLKRQLQPNSVDVRTKINVTAEKIRRAKPDAVVIATGVAETSLDIPGMDKPFVVPAREVLGGKKTAPKVVIIGGGLIGCETAEYLHKHGRQVTIIEILDYIAEKMVYAQKTMLEARLKAAGITIITGARSKEIIDTGVIVITEGGERTHIEAGSVVIAVGDRPNNELETKLKGIAAKIYTAGDCVKPEGIAEAVAAGHLAALSI